MPTHAQEVMAATCAAFDITPASANEIKGTGVEGGALWIKAQELYPNVVWNAETCKVQFADNSAIAYIRDPSSMFSTTYKVVDPTVWKKYPPASKKFVVRKFEREWVGNYRREQWVIVFESDDKGPASDFYYAQSGAYFQLLDESGERPVMLSGTTEA